MADPTDPTTPADSDPVKGAAAELRALKAYLEADNPNQGLPLLFALRAGLNTQTFEAAAAITANDVISLIQFINNPNTIGSLTIPALPHPIIINWGFTLGQSQNDGPVATDFATPFPNAVLFAISSMNNPGAAVDGSYNISSQIVSKSQATLTLLTQSNTAPANGTAGIHNFIAIGY